EVVVDPRFRNVHARPTFLEHAVRDLLVLAGGPTVEGGVQEPDLPEDGRPPGRVPHRKGMGLTTGDLLVETPQAAVIVPGSHRSRGAGHRRRRAPGKADGRVRERAEKGFEPPGRSDLVRVQERDELAGRRLQGDVPA